jgi:hypothetical protein
MKVILALAHSTPSASLSVTSTWRKVNEASEHSSKILFLNRCVAVGGMEHAGARLAALGPSCIYRPRPPYF